MPNEGAAIDTVVPIERLASIVKAKMNDINSQGWLTDVLARVNSLPQSRLAEFAPWN